MMIIIVSNRRFHVYQHVTSFSHMRSALVGKRTTATSFHRQNMCSVCANTLEYWSKYTNILNPTVREDRSVVGPYMYVDRSGKLSDLC